MTREQAIEIAARALAERYRKPHDGRAVGYPDAEIPYARNFIIMAESLGLLKFDADELEAGRCFVRSMGLAWAGSDAVGGPSMLTSVILDDIDRAGFQIVRKARP